MKLLLFDHLGQCQADFPVVQDLYLDYLLDITDSRGRKREGEYCVYTSAPRWHRETPSPVYMIILVKVGHMVHIRAHTRPNGSHRYSKLITGMLLSGGFQGQDSWEPGRSLYPLRAGQNPPEELFLHLMPDPVCEQFEISSRDHDFVYRDLCDMGISDLGKPMREIQLRNGRNLPPPKPTILPPDF